jgi:hypothetical protein
MPASNCTNPPYASAGAITIAGDARSRTPRLTALRRNVVNAKPESPSGAGLAKLFFGGL